ncbi:hypothetical protein J4E80_005444 [Alternaria sp. BMP 0032]|nr:hypothetical protein J4E80_005444 [Alternaria sp. BMP 0032]
MPPTSTTVSAPEPTPTECVCEEVFCILSFPEGCYCQNDAKKACFEKCGGEEPTYQDCSIPIDSVKARAPEPEPVPEPVPAPVPAPQDETCVCEDVICILSFPEGCYCRNDAKKACFEKCGGEEPTYDDCTVDIVTPQPAPTPTPLLPEPICVCEGYVCIQSWPESCLCRNAGEKACFEKCGGEEPTYQDCGVDLTPRAAEPVPEPVPEPQDQVCIWCPEADCTLAFPEGCYCRNDNARKCFEECGGPEPIYEDCSIDIAPRAPEPVPEPVPEPQEDTCECEPVFCLGPGSCRCAYDAAVACAQKCGGLAPPDFCPPRPVEAREAKPEPVPEAKPEPEAEVCTCEPVFCIQSWPESCWCAYDAAAVCAEKCGNPVPVDTCPPRPIEARKAEPEPVPEPVPEPQEETCECEPVVCIAQWPQSCWCFYNAEVRCAAKCGKPAPPPSTCPPIPVEARVAEPEPAPAPIPPPPPPPVCECPLVNCISTQPELCECLNASAQRCYELCGGEKPVPQVSQLATKKSELI